MFVYLNGRYLPEEEATIPITDRGFLYGDGLFSTLRVEEGYPLFWEEHLAKLFDQCQKLSIHPPTIDQTIASKLIGLNHAEKGVWRLKLILTGGTSPRRSLPHRSGTFLMTLSPSEDTEKHPLRMGRYTQPYTTLKTLAYLPRLLVQERALQESVDDCITVTEEGIVLETAFGNLFWIQDDHLFTPTPELPLYYGVTIETVCHVAQEIGYKVVYVKQPIETLPEQGIYFRTNSLGEIWPIGEICKRELPLSPIADLEEGYAKKKRLPERQPL